MDVVTIEPSIFNNNNNSSFKTLPKPLFYKLSKTTHPRILHCTPKTTQYTHKIILTNLQHSKLSRITNLVKKDRGLRSVLVKSSNLDDPLHVGDKFLEILVKKGLILGAVCCVLGCRGAVAVAAEGVVNEQVKLSVMSYMPKVLMVLKVLKEQGLILAALFGLSAFFSMAETSITTLWPWKVRELAEKESENGVFKMLRNDVTRFLTTILIGTT